MKKTPRKIKQWAEEAYESLEKALVLFYEEYPEPTDNEKLALISYSIPFAAMNRGIQDKSTVGAANDLALENLRHDFQVKEPDEPISCSICFLLAYLDAHLSFGILNQKKMDDIMSYLSENFQISIEL